MKKQKMTKATELIEEQVKQLIPILAIKLKECGSYAKLPTSSCSNGYDYKTLYSLVKEYNLMSELNRIQPLESEIKLLEQVIK